MPELRIPSEQTVLVTGGAGIMGRRLAAALQAKEYRTRILCLPAEAAPGGSGDGLRAHGVEVHAGDITNPETLPTVLQGVDIVFHLAAVLLSPLHPELFHAVNAEGTANMVRAAEAVGVRHFIHVSSISVTYPWTNAYSRSKKLSEEIVRSSSLPFTVIRPSLAFEDGGSAEFMRFVDHLKRGPVVFLPGGGKAKKNPVHVDDLVAGFLALPGNSAALGKTYAFAGGEVVTLREMATALLRHMGRSKPVVGFPLWVGYPLVAMAGIWARLIGRENVLTVQSLTGLVQDAAPSITEAAADLGYSPRSFRQGLSSLTTLADCLRRF